MAHALGDPGLYERSILIRSPAPNELQAAHIAEHYVRAGDAGGALRWLQSPWPNDREFTRLTLLDAVYELQGDRAAQTAVRRTILWTWPDVDAYEQLAALLAPSDLPALRDEVATLAKASENAGSAAALLYAIGRPVDAEALLSTRYRTLDGRDYERLLALVRRADAAHSPIGATAVLRALLENILDGGRSTAYEHGRDYLLRARELADRLPAASELSPHDAWERELLGKHGRKRSFWSGL